MFVEFVSGEFSSFALLGMTQLLKTIAAISETHNPNLKIHVLTTMFNKRQNLGKVIPQQVEEFFGQSLVLESIISRMECDKNLKENYDTNLLSTTLFCARSASSKLQLLIM